MRSRSVKLFLDPYQFEQEKTKDVLLQLLALFCSASSQVRLLALLASVLSSSLLNSELFCIIDAESMNF